MTTYRKTPEAIAKLTPAQAMRLWGLEREMCARVIDGLVDAAFLRWTRRGTFAIALRKNC